MEKKTSAEKFKEQIEGSTKFNFWISSCPKNVYEEFKELANKEFADTYHLLLRYLLDEYKKGQEDNSMWEVIRQQKTMIDELESRIAALENNKDDGGIKTFGKVNKNE